MEIRHKEPLPSYARAQYTIWAADYVLISSVLGRFVINAARARRYLLKIFPCLVKVAGPTRTSPQGHVIEDEAVGRFNSQFKLIRGINDLRERISGWYGCKEGPRVIRESFLAGLYETWLAFLTIPLNPFCFVGLEHIRIRIETEILFTTFSD